MNRRTFLLSSIAGAAALAQSKSKRIVFVGGVKSHGPAQHDFPNGIPLMASLVKKSPAFQGAEVETFVEGFPQDLSKLDGASTLVLYFDGVQTPPAPLLEPGRIAELNKLTDRGVGLVCLHQVSTVPEGDTSIPMIRWLGAKRNGMFDRVTEPTALKPETPSFPVCFGLKPFTYEDEFYPTLIFTNDTKRIVPILRAAVPKEKPVDHILAWAYERPNGGRSFGFTGCHYMAAFDQPEIRTMILNAICWTAGLSVPRNGVTIS
jgi:type 1 glutamine amidotransferase